MKKRIKLEKILSLIIYIAIFLFFTIAILFMTKTGEDNYQAYAEAKNDLAHTLLGTYKRLPRIGEYYQHSTIEYYDYQVSFGADLFFRIIDIFLSVGAISALSLVCLGRKPKLKYKDAVVASFFFIALATTRYNEIFTMRFSYLHNYVPIVILLAIFTYYFLVKEKHNKRSTIFAAVCSFLLGFANELGPIAILVMASVYVCVLLFRRRTSFKGILRKYRIQSIMILCLMLGFIFLMSSGGIINRASTAYGDVYEYISIKDFLSMPIRAIIDFAKHVLFNMRYIAIPLLILSLLVVYNVAKKSYNKTTTLQAACLGFSVLYLLGSSQILVLDDLEPRFFSPIVAALAIGIGAFIYSMSKYMTLTKRVVLLTSVPVTLFIFSAVVDISYSRRISYLDYGEQLKSVQSANANEICYARRSAISEPSLLFQYTQISPFEEWAVYDVYGKKIIYQDVCE